MSTLDCTTPERIVVVAGETRDIDITIVDKKTKKPVDITGQTGIKVIFEKADNTKLELTSPGDVTVTSEPRGEMTANLTAANSALLKIGSDQDFEIEITFPSKVIIAQVKDLLDVIARLFS